ncbi:hypothetical protein DFJ73DRAFT_774527 [Zopfochytrium polystomum]|nr:hypothetical protein DFJ73DRAFT_774527 [Zopfochytrium polystomum]
MHDQRDASVPRWAAKALVVAEGMASTDGEHGRLGCGLGSLPRGGGGAVAGTVELVADYASDVDFRRRAPVADLVASEDEALVDLTRRGRVTIIGAMVAGAAALCGRRGGRGGHRRFASGHGGPPLMGGGG